MSLYLTPARWWLASTAFPLIAGTLGPMATAFSICSLSQDWRYETTGKTLRDIPDPEWVLVINGLSVVFAIIANFVLLMEMARRIPFAVAQPIIIIGWYISSILLLCLLAVFAHLMNQPQNAGYSLTQSYYYGALAAGLYAFISSLLLVTFYGAYRGHYSREYKLTTSQRTLMLQTICFLVYLLGGSAVYSRVEGWKFLDALYWSDFTLLTIGIGNIVPTTHLGRSLLFPYAVGGILILSLIIGSIRSLMLEKGKQKMTGRMTEKTRRFLIKKAAAKHSRFHAVVPRLTDDEDDGGQSVRERRKQEFLVMRQVRQLVTLERKWIALLLSLVTWMTMWLIGAAAFWRSEHELQHWTYFQAMYFAYTSLFTIGFGDFYPISNWGKPFFIFWSLLAVPTVTILLSNIGDTLIRSVRDVTIYLGELTILPGDKPVLERIRDLFHAGWRQQVLNETAESEAEAERQESSIPPALRQRERQQAGESEEAGEAASSYPYSESENSMEAEEHRREEVARGRGDVRAENIHHYHYLLFRELRKMIRYASSSLPREFDYPEWEYYLKLIGANESGFISRPEEEEKSKLRPESGPGRDKDQWSWTSARSPLIAEKSEAQWLMEAIAEVLERELKRASREYHIQETKDNKQASE
ncbi:hypothetical protein ASPZODRAFT_71853 [Penicilliopsis zonata CBS 506.65]|uniref:Potassium channel domain-containing protein n=1 Tax=Penicilliopsis zonata CBS 506.65 TaxID=1073090 RepID=A0A1L9SAQ4_9EURO|nr:hypothetical protein ASPZODRAFT_71853 [Penicilliopsis zonata CBS 506.65]OJJ44263.1 hypothetical protein ASPZODRAFT_71853 [Penicilliopsis zonata CBS 506.65]